MEQRQVVLIVDDSFANLAVLGDLLQSDYSVRVANSGPRAIELASRLPLPDLILLDVMMPEMNGHEVLQRLQASPATGDIPVIFTTAMDSTEDEQHGLALGAVDYVTKPLRPPIVMARVRTHLALKAARDELRRHNDSLEAEVRRRMHENELTQEVTIRALARLAETRDNETGNHLLRTQEYVLELARRARAHPRFAKRLDDRSIALMSKSAPLHDIGKVGIPDSILLKPGRLTDEERRVMMTHAQLGANAIALALKDVGEGTDFLVFAQQIAQSHHERWDGSGYPDRLAGEDIPLAARMMAIADVFDALLSRRVYKEPLPPGEVRSIMALERGRQFDPDLLDIFLADYEGFCEIARRYPELEAESAEPAVHATARAS